MPYELVSWAWLSLILLVAGLPVAVRSVGAVVMRDRVPFVCLAALVLLVGALAVWVPFHGQEYEDAFEYLAAGKLLALQPNVRGATLNPICVAGSQLDCEVFGELAHPTGYAVLISWIVRTVGFNLHIAHLCSVAFLALSMGCVFVALRLLGIGVW